MNYYSFCVFQELGYIRSHYNIEDFVYFSHYRPTEHARLCHFILNPVFAAYAKHMIKVRTLNFFYLYTISSDIIILNLVIMIFVNNCRSFFVYLVLVVFTTLSPLLSLVEVVSVQVS